MSAYFVGFGVVGTQETHCKEACGRRSRTERQAGGQEGKILGNKFVILNCIVQELQLVGIVNI